MGFKFDEKGPKKVTTSFLMSQSLKLARDYIIIVALITILKPRRYALFNVDVSADSIQHNISDLMSWRHLVNNYLVACE